MYRANLILYLCIFYFRRSLIGIELMRHVLEDGMLLLLLTVVDTVRAAVLSFRVINGGRKSISSRRGERMWKRGKYDVILHS